MLRPKEKGFSLYISLIILNFLNFCTYGIPITYFPQVAKLRGLMDYSIGLIFSMYPLCSFISSFIIFKVLSRFDRKQIIKYSQIALGLSTMIFGFSTYFTNNFAFIAFAVIGRGFQGMAIGSYTISSYAYVPDYWPEDIDQRIIILEIFLSFGVGVGPLLGSLIYEIWGYISIYVVPGIFIMVIGFCLAHFCFPIAKKDSKETKKQVLNIGESLKIKEIVYTFFAAVINLTSYTLIMPEFENKIIDLNGSPQTASILFSIQAIGYVIACIIQLIVKFENRLGLFFLSLFFNLLSLILLGLDELVPMSNYNVFIFMGIGLFFMGWSVAFSLIPFISEAMIILKKKFPDRQEETIRNMSSTIFNVAIAFAEFSGPILGGVLEDCFGFSTTCLLFALVSFLFFIMFAINAGGFGAFKRFFYKKVENRKENQFIGEMLLYDHENNL